MHASRSSTSLVTRRSDGPDRLTPQSNKSPPKPCMRTRLHLSRRESLKINRAVQCDAAVRRCDARASVNDQNCVWGKGSAPLAARARRDSLRVRVLDVGFVAARARHPSRSSPLGERRAGSRADSNSTLRLTGQNDRLQDVAAPCVEVMIPSRPDNSGPIETHALLG